MLGGGIFILLLCLACILPVAHAKSARVLIYSATRAFRHDSIPTAIEALKAQGTSADIIFDNTEDQSWFSDERLAQYDAVLFLSNTGEILDDSGKTALSNYLNLGGNFVAIHSASDSLVNTIFFRRELGATFDYHPPLQNATVNVIGPDHPSTAGLPKAWSIQDEMYNFLSNPRDVGAIVVLSADESSYTDTGPRSPAQGSPHPTAWFQEHGAGVAKDGIAGRSFYTSLGHLNETWKDPKFLGHVMGGITWTLQSNTTKAFNPQGRVGAGELDSSTPPTSADTNPPSATPGAATDLVAQLYSGLIALVSTLMWLA